MKKKPNHRPVAAKKKSFAVGTAAAADSFYVVGIGASAGGLDALERLFANIPEHSGMAFIVVTHLDPNHVSLMPELLQKVTKIKVLQAEDGMQLKPDHVYVAPADIDRVLEVVSALARKAA